MQHLAKEYDEGVWFVYDGDCPICTIAAKALRIRGAAGELRLLNAREHPDHRLMQEVNRRGLNLDQGMVLIYGGSFHHGRDALLMMALLGSDKGWFNRLNALLFRSRTMVRLCYPLMRATRNSLLWLKGVDKIANLSSLSPRPIFQNIFGNDWDALPPVMKKHYAVRLFSSDRVVAKGHLDVKISPMVSLMARLTGMLLPWSGDKVPVTVTFYSGPDSHAFHFDRIFHFPDRGDIRFHSRMEPVGRNEMVEFMRFGIGWKCAFDWDGSKVILSHRGYVWRIFGVMIPLPLGWLMGRGHAEETRLTEEEFSMWTHAKSPLFGPTFGYKGTFKITEVSCPEKY